MPLSRKRTMIRSAALLLGAAVLLPFTAAAQEGGALILPRSQEEMRKYMTAGSTECPGCGVVTNVRQSTVRTRVSGTEEAGAELRTGDAGPGEDVKTTTIAGTGSQSRQARKQTAKPAAKPWVVTVRYDDGSLASFEQASQPRVSVGQRVRVVGGQVQPR